jgi:hypothetical protein
LPREDFRCTAHYRAYLIVIQGVVAMHRNVFRVGCLALLLSLCATDFLGENVRANDELLAGVASVEITPPVGYRMSGYFSERLSTGTRDPLQAKALVLRQGEWQAALVFCDLIGISREIAQRARRAAEERTGISADCIAVCCTHSHTGPLYSGALRNYFHRQAVERSGSDPCESVDYPALLADRVAAAVAEAQAAAAPMRMSAGGATPAPQLSFNRRFHMRDGSVRFNPGQKNPDIVRPAGPIDPEAKIVALDPAEGAGQRAVLTVFALHLDTVGGTEYSADYPAHLATGLRERLGADVVSLFGAGTCGDINHVDVTIEGRRTAEQIGGLLAESVAAAVPSLAPQAEPSLAVRTSTIDVPKQQFTAEEIAAAERDLAGIGSREVPFLEQVRTYKIAAVQLYPPDVVPLDVQCFRLSREVALVTLPGEVFVELGLAIQAASPFATTLVVELANDAPGYIPTRKAFAEGSYETVNSRIEPGGGEQMVDEALRLLGELAETE